LNRAEFDKIFDSVKIEQTKEDLFWLVNKVEQINPHIIIELGVKWGGTLRFWEQLLRPNDLLIGVDINPETASRISWDWKNSDRDIKIVIGNTNKPETAEIVKQFLFDKHLEGFGLGADFLYIDACHSFEAVTKDFNNFSPLVRKGGIVGFHDLYLERSGVKPFFELLGGKKEVCSKGYGTGVWWKL